jgi:hypothetical protein
MKAIWAISLMSGLRSEHQGWHWLSSPELSTSIQSQNGGPLLAGCWEKNTNDWRPTVAVLQLPLQSPCLPSLADPWKRYKLRRKEFGKVVPASANSLAHRPISISIPFTIMPLKPSCSEPAGALASVACRSSGVPGLVNWRWDTGEIHV